MQVAGRQVVARNEHDRLLDYQPDRRKIGCGIIERFLMQRLVLRMGSRGAHHELIAVRCRLRDAVCADHAAGPADVLDDDLLAQDVRERLAQDSGDDIGRAAGRERNHHGHRPGWPVLRPGRYRMQSERKSDRRCFDEGWFAHGRLLSANPTMVGHGAP